MYVTPIQADIQQSNMTWSVFYQAFFNKANLLIKCDMCMKFYNDTKQLYLETDASGIGLGAALLQM